MKPWYIDEQFMLPYQKAVVSGEVPPSDPAKIAAIRANADRWSDATYAAENLQVHNGVAKIDVKGVLLQNATFIDELYAKYLGENYATYPGIAMQIKLAEADPRVDSIELYIDSPGGEVAGLDEAAMILAGCKKKKKAKVSWMAASAAYYMASQADEIEATTPAASFGSIGVVVDMVDASEAWEKIGVRFYSVTSTKAPRKRQPPHSDEFKAELRARLDDLHEIFATRVAEGRSRATGKTVSIDTVNMNFGQGGLLIAKAAESVGMIDRIEQVAPNQEVAVSEVTKAQATEEFVAQGVKQERARVASLLPWMGADPDRVVAAIKSGESLSPEMVTELSEKAAAKAAEAREQKAKADQEAREAEALKAREADAAPQLTAKASEKDVPKSDNDIKLDAIRAEARKNLNLGGN